MSIITKRVKRDFIDSCTRIRRGSLRLITPEGDVHNFGQGTPEAEMQIRDWAVVTAMAARGDIGFGETYVAGLWDSPSIDMLTRVALLNRDYLSTYTDPSPWRTFIYHAIDRILRANSKSRAKRNIKAHYDVGNEFYQLWLDESMTYSSALFSPEITDETLEQAQARKYDRILGKTVDAEHILEVGCGWGGFANRAADAGHKVTGITISPSQHGYADAHLDGRADIKLQDYRDTKGRFDAIVSIEMIEAVGERYWPQYFQMLKNRLNEGGKAIIQAITVDDSYFDLYRRNSDYIRQYTFPGGMLLSDAMIAHHARTAGLEVRQNFHFGQSYGRTCALWSQRLADASPKIRALGYDETFLRNWQFYLQLCAGTFVARQTDVVQVELHHAS